MLIVFVILRLIRITITYILRRLLCYEIITCNSFLITSIFVHETNKSCEIYFDSYRLDTFMSHEIQELINRVGLESLVRNDRVPSLQLHL